jgi:hypothetical protein
MKRSTDAINDRPTVAQPTKEIIGLGSRPIRSPLMRTPTSGNKGTKKI